MVGGGGTERVRRTGGAQYPPFGGAGAGGPAAGAHAGGRGGGRGGARYPPGGGTTRTRSQGRNRSGTRGRHPAAGDPAA